MFDRCVWPNRSRLFAGILLTLTITVGSAVGQDDPRPFAPGVVKVVPPIIDIRDTFSLPMPLPGRKSEPAELNQYPGAESLHQRTQHVIFYRDVYQYEFAFLPLRQLTVDIPYPNGKMRKKNVWYLVYRVRNLGVNASYEKSREQTFGHELHKLNTNVDQLGQEVMQGRFIPKFSLEGWVQDNETKEYRRVEYAEQILPTAVMDIQDEEDANRPLLSTPEIIRTELPEVDAESGEGTWAVATWTDVNPKIDFVSVYVQGITNAIRIVRTADSDSPDFKKKTLQINFWRPGDEIRENEDSIRYGIPLVEEPQRQIEIARRYQLPGPQFEIYEQDKGTNLVNLVAEAPVEVDMRTLETPVVNVLNDGKLPESLKTAFANIGVEVPEGATLNRDIVNARWSLSVTVDGTEKLYQIRLVPQFWEKEGEGIRFIKSLDYMWIYR
jgi:hypothetical protein